MLIIADYQTDSTLSFDEVCEACRINEEFIRQLVAFNVIPEKFSYTVQETYDLATVKKIKTALRLQRDLEINMAGIALVLDLLQEINDLKAQVKINEKYL